MTQAVTLPLWLFVILLLLAALAALEWLLLPSVHWYLRRKVDRVIREINVRFNIELPAFKLTRRRALIERLFHDPKVQAAALTHAAEKNVPLKLARQRADFYAREIVPAFNAYLYFRVGYWLAKRCAQFLYRVRLGYTDADSLRAINPKSTVVFVMNHRSNMDYVLVAFLAAERVALSYAVGEWARVWPLQSLIRAMGAYFVHRNSGDPLYRTVLQRYVQMATEGGVPQAIYPEGGLTLDGKLRPPKACSTTCCVPSTRRPSATWCSSRSASTTTACSKTAPNSRSSTSIASGTASPMRSASPRASSASSSSTCCAAAGTGSATPA